MAPAFGDACDVSFGPSVPPSCFTAAGRPRFLADAFGSAAACTGRFLAMAEGTMDLCSEAMANWLLELIAKPPPQQLIRHNATSGTKCVLENAMGFKTSFQA